MFYRQPEPDAPQWPFVEPQPSYNDTVEPEYRFGAGVEDTGRHSTVRAEVLPSLLETLNVDGSGTDEPADFSFLQRTPYTGAQNISNTQMDKQTDDPSAWLSFIGSPILALYLNMEPDAQQAQVAPTAAYRGLGSHVRAHSDESESYFVDSSDLKFGSARKRSYHSNPTTPSVSPPVKQPSRPAHDQVKKRKLIFGDDVTPPAQSPPRQLHSFSTLPETTSGADPFHDLSDTPDGDTINQPANTPSNPNVKSFLKDFRAAGKEGYTAARSFVFGNNWTGLEPSHSPPRLATSTSATLRSLPKEVQAQVLLELADLAKRDSEFVQARVLFQGANWLHPHNAKTWLEYSRMEEENGNLSVAKDLLATAFRFSQETDDRIGREAVVLRLLRLFSRIGDSVSARKLIGVVLSTYIAQQKAHASQSWSDEDTAVPTFSPKSSPTKKMALPRVVSNGGDEDDDFDERDSHKKGPMFPWRVIMEGASIEFRFGKRSLAHRIMKYMMQSIPCRTQPYIFAADLYKKESKFLEAYRVILIGLRHLPNAGMLYFEALHLQQLISVYHRPAFDTDPMDLDDPDFGVVSLPPWTSSEYLTSVLPQFLHMASINLSPELVWKLHSEVASIYERVGHVEMARKSLVLSERHAPENLIWKVWLHGARVELACGSIAAGRRLLVRSLCAVPKRMSSQVLLEFAHFEEVLGNLDKARYILSKAKKDTDNEWKVLLESVLLEMRCQELDRAITSAREALRLHPSTGRLWAILIQLEHIKTYSSPSDGSALAVFQEALNEVPKSGEVWCEGARLAIHRGDLQQARKFLDFSLHFTPQYGDSLIEYLRLEMLEGTTDIEDSKLFQICASAEPDYGPVWAYCKQHPLDSGVHNLFVNAARMLKELQFPNMDISTWIATRNFEALSAAERRKISFA